MGRIAATLIEIKPESPDAATLRLDIGAVPFDYRPGQHVQIDPNQFPALKGRSQGPGYFALSSDATEPGLLEITVRARPSASSLASHLVRRARPGETIVLEGPGGLYALPESPPEGVEGFLHLCAGSGVAPNRGMIRHALLRGWPQRQVLLLQERASEDILFRAEWDDLSRRHPDRFRFRILLSGKGEYVTADLVRGAVDPGRFMAFVCGPNRLRSDGPGFCDRWCGDSGLVALGFSSGRVLCAGR